MDRIGRWRMPMPHACLTACVQVEQAQSQDTWEAGRGTDVALIFFFGACRWRTPRGEGSASVEASTSHQVPATSVQSQSGVRRRHAPRNLQKRKQVLAFERELIESDEMQQRLDELRGKVFVHICRHGCAHVCTHVCAHVWTHVYTYAYICLCTYLDTCLDACLHTCLDTFLGTCLDTCL